MEDIIAEVEENIIKQENYFGLLIDMGLFYQCIGQNEKAFDIYKKGLEKADLLTKYVINSKKKTL